MGQRYIACANCNGNMFKELTSVVGNRGVNFISYDHHIAICKNCGLVFINPQHDDQDYDEYYRVLNYRKEKSVSKNRILSKHKFKKIPIRFLIDHIKRDYEFGKQIQVMDIGCGFGESIKFMQEFGLEAEGLEPSSIAADFASNHFGAKVHVGSIYNHDLPQNNYDILTCMAVIEHLTNPLAALKEMWNILKPNGILFINTPDLKGMVLRKGIDRYFKFVHTFYYTDVTLSSLMQLAGFGIVKIWQLPPILKYSTFFHPTNSKRGELNIIARKIDIPADPLPLKDDVDEIFNIFEKSKRRDARFIKYRNIMKMKVFGFPFRMIKKKLTKPKYVYSEYFDSRGVVSDYLEK